VALHQFEVTLRSVRSPGCRVRVGAGALSMLVPDLSRALSGRRVFVISDSNVAPLHAERLIERLRAGGIATELLVFPAGEAHKTRQTKHRLEDELLVFGAGSDAAMLALGGGVTGDLAGFVAATWHRGVPVIQVPTSLLAMTDAALGGKTAVDLPGAKNLVGSYHQPWGVYADTELLSTLPSEQYVQGFAEMVKIAAVADGRLFTWLEASTEALLGRDPDALAHALRRCLELKGRIVARDERDRGPRTMLNFGHTVGHALELLSGYRIDHGSAVGLGLRAESHLAQELTGFPARHSTRLASLLDRLGLPVRRDSIDSEAALVSAFGRDKKTRAGQVHCALPARLGRMPKGCWLSPVDPARLARAVVDIVRGGGR
jgi:3-dehydroquinate synthase